MTAVTLVGNLTADPELRFTPSGLAWASFTVASTPRFLDKSTGEWVDGETLFMRCSVWREVAEHLAESLSRGARVVVVGKLAARSWEADDGTKRTVVECAVDEVAASIKYATVRVAKVERAPAGVPVGVPA